MATQNQPNLWPFTRRKTAPKGKPKAKPAQSSLTIGEAMAKTFKAGKESGDTGLFRTWLDRSGLATRSGDLRARLEREYRRGVEAPAYNAPPKPGSRAKQSKEFKGRKIEAHEDGSYSVPSIDRDSRFDSVTDAKQFIGAWKANPNATTARHEKQIRNYIAEAFASGTKPETIAKYIWLKWGYLTGTKDGTLQVKMSSGLQTFTPTGENPTDRAHRYRANATPPEGPRLCAFCRTKSNVEVGHIDGHEEHNEPENLIWTCRSCNVIAGNTLKAANLGRRTRQFNPTKSGGAANTMEWLIALGSIVPHKGAQYAADNYGAPSQQMATADAVAMVRATPMSKRKEFAAKMGSHKSTRARSRDEREDRWNPKRDDAYYAKYPEKDWYGRKKGKKNPQSEADALYESFHGKPSEKTILIEEEVHEHVHLTTLGTLVELWVETLSGLLAHLEFDQENTPYLASSEDGKQLYIEGGDQELDLAALKMDGDEWRKDRMVIGTFARPEPASKGRERRKHNITYQTEKKFDDFEPIDYQHDLGEETQIRPMLEYEPRNQRLYITGGQYRIEQPLFEMSPGIEN